MSHVAVRANAKQRLVLHERPLEGVRIQVRRIRGQSPLLVSREVPTAIGIVPSVGIEMLEGVGGVIEIHVVTGHHERSRERPSVPCRRDESLAPIGTHRAVTIHERVESTVHVIACFGSEIREGFQDCDGPIRMLQILATGLVARRASGRGATSGEGASIARGATACDGTSPSNGASITSGATACEGATACDRASRARASRARASGATVSQRTDDLWGGIPPCYVGAVTERFERR